MTYFFTLITQISEPAMKNKCRFTCPTGEIPTIAETKCLISKHGAFYDNQGPVMCVPRPPDTQCGNVEDVYALAIDQSFEIQADGKTVIFFCPYG